MVGQPNVGKSTVFNMLTGLNQHVGNWPGKTVEQKIGAYRHNGTLLNLVDLPGTYSLTANSEEERIARDYLVRERPDVVIAVVNAAALERSLYLVAELLSLPQPLVLGLNMSDVAEQHGIRVESHVLAAALGVPVIPLIATKNAGVKELVDAALRVTADPAAWQPNRPTIRAEHRPVLEELCALITGHVPAPYPEDWVALKLLEGDAEITALVRQALPAQTWERVHALLMQHEDAYLDIAGGRYEWIGRMVRAAVIQPRAGAITRTERIDRVATHPIWGLVLLLAMFGLIFWLTYAVATPIAGWLSKWVLGGLDAVAAIALRGAPPWLFGLVSDGLIHGVGTVFTFLPILVIFFAALGTLEDVGYLARGAYVMDRFMHLMGLHGKSFMPLFLGFGCNVPAVLGARILEDRRARLLTILLAPLVPCTARLAVIAFLDPRILPASRGAGLVGVGGAEPGSAGGCRDRRQPAGVPGRAHGLHHGVAALSRPESPHGGSLCQEQYGKLRQEGRHADPDRLDGRLGALDTARPRHRAELPGLLRPRAGAGRRADGPGQLAGDRGAADQFLRQREHHRHAGCPVRVRSRRPARWRRRSRWR